MERERPQAGRDAQADLSDLVEAVARTRDRAAFAHLFEHYAPRIKAYFLRLTVSGAEADELVQEAMLAVWRRAETYDRRQSSVATWIFTIARNKRIDALRRNRRPDLDLNAPGLVPEPEPGAFQQLEARETAARLKAAVAGLPDEQRELLDLAFFQDISHRDIARSRGLPLGTVKSRLRLALARLRQAVAEGEDGS